MFTGIVEAVGTVLARREGGLSIEAASLAGVVSGDSVSVNGCCLTATSVGAVLEFDLSEETLSRTSLGKLAIGSSVNLEQAMLASGRFGGHIVQGHVDCVGELVSRRVEEGSEVFRFSIPAPFAKYVIEKGSITLDGISLTVVLPPGEETLGHVFEVWVIPHTLSHTNLATAQAGSIVNVEFDVLAKYVERLLQVSPK